ncbi:MAG: hypothetical protein AAGA90_23420 [Actinomycetota bacterium]
MIVVLEGISAAGKTTHAAGFGADHVVSEFPEVGVPPGPDDPADAHAEYWLEHNIRRFRSALEVEAAHGYAICDTDPFKAPYDWCRAEAGFASPDVFRCAVPRAREAIAGGRLGFADRYYVKPIESEVARAQRDGDATRSRRNFEMHLALQPHLLRWYAAVEVVLPGRVEFAFPDHDTVLHRIERAPRSHPSHRFDPSVLDRVLDELDRTD